MTHVPPRLIPELVVTDIAVSVAFWRNVLGFAVIYDRPEDGFAMLQRDGVRINARPGRRRRSR